MQSNFDAVVSTLSMRMFHVPPAHLQEVIELSQASPEQSLLETLSELGHFRLEEKRLLEDLSEAIRTASGWRVARHDLGHAHRRTPSPPRRLESPCQQGRL